MNPFATRLSLPLIAPFHHSLSSLLLLYLLLLPQLHAPTNRVEYTKEAKQLYEKVIQADSKHNANDTILVPLVTMETVDQKQDQGQDQDQDQDQECYYFYVYNAMDNLAILLTDEVLEYTLLPLPFTLSFTLSFHPPLPSTRPPILDSFSLNSLTNVDLYLTSIVHCTFHIIPFVY